MIYGATHSLEIAEISKVIATIPHGQTSLVVFALVFIVAGLAFKFGAAPFHLWVPDVYEGAPTSITLFISSAPKIAALGMMIRVLVEGLPTLSGEWQQLLIVVAISSMALGNIVAIMQDNLKRLLAYSAIGHMGFVLLGIIAGTYQGYSASVFYVITYAIMSVAGFGTLILLSKSGFDAQTIEDVKGLNHRSPWLAFLFMITLLSMAGMPPLVGFFAKLSVLDALVDSGFYWLAALSLLFSLIGAYYYLRVVKTMYFEDADDTTTIVTSMESRVAISFNGLLLLALGLFPGWLLAICQAAF